MKYLILVVFGTGLCIGSAYYLHHARAASIPPQESTAPSVTVVPDDQPVASTPPIRQESTSAPDESAKSQVAPNLPAISKGAPFDKIALSHALDVLVSSQVSHEEKRAVWAQLKAKGSLDQAIHELEERTASNPSSPESAAALGQAYLQKCGTITDVREQGILAMQADKVFDTALALDPANWEARFTKAVALTYWPASMNKGDEVVQHFQTLIQQQETQPPQPQFAETYVWLGDQYQKTGQADEARAAWQRGATLFPQQQQLQSRLAGSH